jgi:hypothetical protein
MVDRTLTVGFGARRRRAVAVLVVIGAMVWSCTTPASALPNDPNDPPPIGGDAPEPFTPPANGFNWSVPSRFGAVRNGIVDYHWNETADSDHTGPAYTYDPNYVNPSVFPADFDGCPSQSEEDAGANATNSYTWTLDASGSFPAATFGPQHDCHLGRPQFAGFPAQGTYHVTLTVTDPSNVSTPYPQDVTIKDLLIVSLGDSYASGEGNPDVPETYSTDIFGGNPHIDTPARWEDRRCHRSAYAAPAQTALALEGADPHTSVTFLSFACSGATIDTSSDGGAWAFDPYAPVPPNKPVGTGVLGPYIGAEPPTYSAFDDNALNYNDKLPSQIDQLSYALGPTSGRRPIDALMLSAGGNDIGFSPIAGVCVLYSDCTNSQVTNATVTGREALSDRVNESAAAMASKYDALATALAPFDAGKTYITEYPDPTRNDSGNYCDKILDDVIPWWMAPLLALVAVPNGYNPPPPPFQMEGNEVAWAGGTVGSELKHEVTNAAQAHGWTLVTGINDDQGNLFSGHGYCASDSWIRHAHDATYLQGPLGQMLPPDSAKTKGTLHPTATGLQQISQKIFAKARPDLLPTPPSPPPAFTTSNNDGSVTSVQGANGWLLGGCATGTPCPAAFTVDASDALGLRGASFKLNGSDASCPNPAPGLTCSTSTTVDSHRIVDYRWDFQASDGIFDLDFSVTGRDGQPAHYSREAKVDLADPVDASASITSAPPAANGWYRAPADVTLTGLDAGASGIHGVAYELDGAGTQTVDSGTQITVTGDGTHTLTYRPVDWAGRTGATHSATIQIDSIAPDVSCGTSDGAWHATDVSITCTAVDADPTSGLAPPTDSTFSLSTSVPAGTEDANASTSSHAFCDVAGNCSTAGPIVGNHVDKKGPTIQFSTPIAGAVYTLGQPVTAGYSCSDGGSGVSSCIGTVANGAQLETSSVGNKQFQVTSADNVGHVTTLSVGYQVRYPFIGFASPMDNLPTVNVLKAGAAAPVKFSLSGYRGNAVLASGSPSSQQVACNALAPLDSDTPTVAADSSGLSYDAAADQYSYVWKTDRSWSGTCRRLTVTLSDGTAHVLDFKFK